MKFTFPFEQEASSLFGKIYRPIARFDFWSLRLNRWVSMDLLIDTGADYSLMPRFLAYDLGIDLRKDCKRIRTAGVGGNEVVHLFPACKVRLGDHTFQIPIGFLAHNNIPALLGRQACLERFKILLHKHRATFWT